MCRAAKRILAQGMSEPPFLCTGSVVDHKSYEVSMGASFSMFQFCGDSLFGQSPGLSFEAAFAFHTLLLGGGVGSET